MADDLALMYARTLAELRQAAWALLHQLVAGEDGLIRRRLRHTAGQPGRWHMRVLCPLLGCRWQLLRHLPEADPRWDRREFRCARCGDRRKVWVGNRGTGLPDRCYEQLRSLVAACAEQDSGEP